MESPNLFERFFATQERYLRHLVKEYNAVGQYPAFVTFQLSAAIARKIKAEYDAMAIYYRESALPNAQQMVNTLLQQYNESQHKLDYSDTIGPSHIFEDSFNGILREVIMGGYISISHKIEMLIGFVTSHSGGGGYASLPAPDGYKTIPYIHLLQDEFGLSFDKLLETEPNVKPKNNIYTYHNIPGIITRRIAKIRMTANRVKHQGGYPKHAFDPIIEFYPDFLRYEKFGEDDKKRSTFRIPFNVDEFLLDLDYADKYITHILELVDSVHLYAVAKSISNEPVTPGQEQYRYHIVTNIIPTYRDYIKTLVTQIKDVWLDRPLPPDKRLAKPSRHIIDESNLS